MSLAVGLEKAASLHREYGVPVLGVNHLEGHALAVRLETEVAFPYLLLLVSGGHTELIICFGVNNYRKLGETKDDAVGEAFDKGARELGLIFGTNGKQYGALLEGMASSGTVLTELSKPMIQNANFDFSFSGLKTAFRRLVALQPKPLDYDMQCNLAATYQQGLVGHLWERSRRALRWCQQNAVKVTAFVVSGGVAQNKYLQQQIEVLAKSFDLTAVFPSAQLCSDNGVMIAWAAQERLAAGFPLQHQADLARKQRWSLDPSPDRPDYLNARRYRKLQEAQAAEALSTSSAEALSGELTQTKPEGSTEEG